jgi:hypothetical protein
MVNLSASSDEDFFGEIPELEPIKEDEDEEYSLVSVGEEKDQSGQKVAVGVGIGLLALWFLRNSGFNKGRGLGSSEQKSNEKGILNPDGTVKGQGSENKSLNEGVTKPVTPPTIPPEPLRPDRIIHNADVGPKPEYLVQFIHTIEDIPKIFIKVGNKTFGPIYVLDKSDGNPSNDMIMRMYEILDSILKKVALENGIVLFLKKNEDLVGTSNALRSVLRDNEIAYTEWTINYPSSAIIHIEMVK